MVETFTACGGNHRTKALEEVVQKREKKIKGLEEKLTRWKGKQKSKRKVQDLKKEIKTLKGFKAAMGKWTVILYDEGK